MKKSILIICSFVLTLGGLTSCKDFLDRAPIDQLSDASFWKTLDDAQRYTGDMYRSLPDFWSLDNDVNSDDLTHGIKWAEGQMAISGLYDPASFSWDYSLARKANLFLEKVDLIADGSSAAQLNVVKAEARWFRAYFYADMIKSFGDVPYVDKPLLLSELMIPRTPIKEVYAKIMEDINFAIANLPVQPYQAGRLTKGAALALLAEIQIYFAGFPAGTMGGGLSTYTQAAATAKQIMDLGQYELWDKDNTQGNYQELFWEPGRNAKEFILTYTHKADGVFDNQILGWESFPNVGWGGVNPTQSLVDAFEDSEGAPIKNSTIYDPTQPWKNRDPRFNINVIYHGCTLSAWGGPFNMTPSGKTTLSDGSVRGTGLGLNDASQTGYNQRKWVDQTVSIDQANAWESSAHFPIWRYAEVLLWFAEAENEVSGPTAAAFDAINQVRARVGQPLLQNTDTSLPTYVASKEAFRERVRNEYRVELACEGKRFWAIRRWREADGKPLALKVMSGTVIGGVDYNIYGMPMTTSTVRNYKNTADSMVYTPFVGANITPIQREKGIRRFQEWNIFYPVPQTEIDLNPELKQNPGYAGGPAWQ